MRGVDEAAQVLGPAVGAGRRAPDRRRRSPSSAAGEIGDGHQLDRGDAEAGSARAAGRSARRRFPRGCRRRRGARRRQIVDRQPGPGFVAPSERPRVDDLGRAVDPLRLEPRGGIRVRLAAIEPVLVAGSRGQPGNEPFVQSICVADQRMIGQPTLTVDLDLDRRCRGRPDRKVDATIPDRRAEISTGFRWRLSVIDMRYYIFGDSSDALPSDHSRQR